MLGTWDNAALTWNNTHTHKQAPTVFIVLLTKHMYKALLYVNEFKHA